MGRGKFLIVSVLVQMRHRCHKAIVLFLLGGYSLAVTVSGAFHTHSSDDCCATKPKPADTCHSHACDHGHSHATYAHGAEESDSSTPDALAISPAYDCAVCSFLAQKPIPATAQASECSTELEQPLVRVRAVPPSDDAPATIFGRGPPSIA